MKTTAKTIGFYNGYRTGGRQAGCNATGFLSQPCSRFEMPPTKRSDRTAGTRTVTRQNRRKQFDEAIIARHSLPVRVAISIVVALTLSGVLPMALATFEIHLANTYGIAAFVACMAVDAAVIYWLVRHA